ncbi:MAG: QacE family quaternary ammonium compound efflux SMR transporter [Burkholderiaceae bacterium]|nr:QacE family quaternary ammonium compound efflux SMR transporter [Burkholderiaceae bacterium]
MSPDWWLLAVAIAAEVVATAALKLTDGLRRWWPWLIVMSGYSLALYLLSLTLDTLPVGVAYAIWSGSGVALMTVVGWFAFGQKLDRPALLGIALIVAGVVLLQGFSGAVPR